jgi:demethylspheroidene O-methyltransferase
MPDDGELVIAEPMVTDERDAARVAAYFDLYLLAMGQGRPRRPDELAAILRRAGFDEPRLARSSWPMLVRIMRARPGLRP